MPSESVSRAGGHGAEDCGLFWAPQAWVAGAWHHGVVLQVDSHEHWSAIEPGIVTPPENACVLPGPVLPGLVDAHSHAFQRAFAGLAERRESEADDFWSWRDGMYRIASNITPAQLQAVATQLYVELLRGGYTQVCEFHYLQHQPDGRPYDDPLTMSWALADAAAAAGIGLTLLPVLYQRAGFAERTLRPEQRRFASTPVSVWAACEAVRDSGRHLLNAGIAVHSLRATDPDAMRRLLAAHERDEGPIHIHVAEQQREVDECVAVTGRRPIEWLCGEIGLDARWQLVHATHATPDEIDAVARCGAGIVFCPGTEANLGDGLPDLTRWLAGGVPWSLGSDSHVTRSWTEELRWLEYGQRMTLKRRNVSAAPERGLPATATRLFENALHGGARAAGLKRWGLQVGARADLLVLDTGDPAMLGVHPERRLDAFVFSSPSEAIRDVYVAGRCVLRQRRHTQQAPIAAGFEQAMRELQRRA